jgi:Aromatic acid exporter family member 1
MAPPSLPVPDGHPVPRNTRFTPAGCPPRRASFGPSFHHGRVAPLARRPRRPRRWSSARVAERLRLRRPARPAVGWTLRLTVAAVASYVVAELAFPGSAPLTAALTALLVVQLTPVSLLVSGLDRVVSVVAGVGLAVLVSSAVGLTWWSLGLIIAISLVVGQVLRLGPNLLEVPISAMLVLGAGAVGTSAAASDRIWQTLIGAGVGVLSNVAFPPRVVVPDAAHAIEELGRSFADLLDEAAADLASPDAEGSQLADRAGWWLGRARQLTHGTPAVGATLLKAEESRRLNVRAIGTADAGPGLRHGLEAFEHSAVAIRSLFGTLQVVADRFDDEQRALDPQLRASFAVVLEEMAMGLREFGRLVREEVRPGEHAVEADDVRIALDTLHEARARIDELQLVNPREDLLLTELIAAFGTTVERLLRELDLEERGRRWPRESRMGTRLRRPLRPSLPALPPLPLVRPHRPDRR